MPRSAFHVSLSSQDTTRALQWMVNQAGKPYVWGGTGPRGFDCSGIGYAAHKAVGNRPNHRFTTWSVMRYGQGISRSQLQPGDAIVTNGGTHMVWYIGAGNVMEFASRGTRGRVRKLANDESIHAIRRLSPPGNLVSVSGGVISNANFDGTPANGVTDLIKITEPLAAIADSITDRSFWIRFAMFAGGVVLILLGAVMMIGTRVTSAIGNLI